MASDGRAVYGELKHDYSLQLIKTYFVNKSDLPDIELKAVYSESTNSLNDIYTINAHLYAPQKVDKLLGCISLAGALFTI